MHINDNKHTSYLVKMDQRGILLIEQRLRTARVLKLQRQRRRRHANHMQLTHLQLHTLLSGRSHLEEKIRKKINSVWKGMH